MAKKTIKKLNRIKEVATEKGITQAEIAKKMGVEIMTVSAWYSNRQHPRLADLNKLAGILGVNMCQLLNE